MHARSSNILTLVTTNSSRCFLPKSDNRITLLTHISLSFSIFFNSSHTSRRCDLQFATMGKKKRGHPDVEDILARPWCYYCELRKLLNRTTHFRG